MRNDMMREMMPLSFHFQIRSARHLGRDGRKLVAKQCGAGDVARAAVKGKEFTRRRRAAGESRKKSETTGMGDRPETWKREKGGQGEKGGKASCDLYAPGRTHTERQNSRIAAASARFSCPLSCPLPTCLPSFPRPHRPTHPPPMDHHDHQPAQYRGSHHSTLDSKRSTITSNYEKTLEDSPQGTINRSYPPVHSASYSAHNSLVIPPRKTVTRTTRWVRIIPRSFTRSSAYPSPAHPLAAHPDL
jgi:hypothetical protein